jgi:hypothetical protein
MWYKSIGELGKKVCKLYPFLCKHCDEIGHFNFQCSSPNSYSSSTASLYYDDKITLNQHDELTLFLACEEISRKISLIDINDVDINSTLRSCHLYCVKDCLTNTYIQNLIKHDILSSYCRCNGYRGILVHLLLGPVIGPSSAQGIISDPSHGEDSHEEAPREENDAQKQLRTRRPPHEPLLVRRGSTPTSAQHVCVQSKRTTGRRPRTAHATPDREETNFRCVCPKRHSGSWPPP